MSPAAGIAEGDVTAQVASAYLLELVVIRPFDVAPNDPLE
jgi:hypothetical protein